MNGQNEFFKITSSQGRDILSLQGDWVIDHSSGIMAALGHMDKISVSGVDASSVGRMDLWGSLRLKELLANLNVPANLNERQHKIFDFMSKEPSAPPKPEKQSTLFTAFSALGKLFYEGAKTTYGVIAFIGEIAVTFSKNILKPSGFRIHSIIRHIDETGLRALPIVGLLAILISMVISYQAATQLQKFGANIFTIDLTVISLLREMGVLITAIMVAGRSGSAFAAEIGVMKLREEVDALKTMGMNPVEILVLPRLIALAITLPILAFLADIIGLMGGAVISVALLDIPIDQYIARVQSVATATMFFVGIIKAPVFAFIITIVGCYQGMNVTGSAESVGQLTTKAVVQSIFLVIMADAFFSILFANLGI